MVELPAAIGPALAGAGLLVVAALPKLRDPSPTAAAVRSVGVSLAGSVVRLLAAAELALGSVAAIVGGRICWTLVAMTYAGFAGYVVIARRRGASDCGCTGGPTKTPPVRSHVLLNAVLAGAAAAAAWQSAAGLASVPATSQSLVVLGFAALLGWLGWLALTVLPRLSSIARAG